MRKINLILLAVALLAISCSGDNPAGPSMGRKGIYTINGYGVLYDKQNQSWDEEKKEHILTRRYDGDISIRRANYYNCFGKNWRKGISNDYSGALLESLLTSGDSTIYIYDGNNFLIAITRYRDGEVEIKSEYQNENGKIKTEIHTSTTSTSVKNYEYGENRYIKREYHGDPNDQTTSFFEYHHDNNGYVTEKWYYSHQSDPDPGKEIFIYNNQGLLIRKEDEGGNIHTEYKYNSLGLNSEMIDGNDKSEYKFNSKGMLIENISYKDGKPWSKMEIEYVD